MTYDLRREPWIPWRRRSGTVEWGPPAALVSRMVGNDADPVVAVAAPRPDFDGALQEFLVGLLSAALQPADEDAWLDGWHAPPSVETLQAALDALPDAFDLEGDGPRFFQDLSEADLHAGRQWAIESLLMDFPGATTMDAGRRTFTTDLFVKSGRVHRVSRPAAAMALVTMQTYAPEGGRGHLTSMRGGGPLTTLVDPRSGISNPAEVAHDQPLWSKLWANVETSVQLLERSTGATPHDITPAFPWLYGTRASDPPQRLSTTPADAHPLQAYFGMPRRIRLEFENEGWCDLTGREDARTVTSFWMRAYGVDYEGWRHPLSPYSRLKSSGDWSAMHGQPGGLYWRDWVTVALDAPQVDRQPARCVSAFARRARAVGIRRSFRVHAFGYDTDHKKARGWTDAVLPAFAVASAERRTLLHSTARGLVEATSLAGTAVLGAVKTALFQSPDDVPGDLGQVRLDLWAATEPHFYAAVEAVADPDLDEDAASDRAAESRRGYLTPLADAATAVFDRWCPSGSLPPERLRRRVAGRNALVQALRGYSKLGESIFAALEVAPPGGGRAARATARKTRTPKETAK